MKKKLFLLTGIAGFSFVSAQQKDTPNIVFILADDMGYGDVSVLNENSKIQTAYIDAMASNGIIFTDAHSSSSVSTPTRYGLLTGRYNWRSSLKQGVLNGYSKPLIPESRTTIASMLKDKGYTGACIGKWHLGWNWAEMIPDPDSKNKRGIAPENVDYSKTIKGGPADVGFDYFFGFCASLDMPPYVYVENTRPTVSSVDSVAGTPMPGFWRGGAIGSDFSHQDCLQKITETAIGYIEKQSAGSQPFFLYLPLPAPHTPILPAKEFKGKTGIGEYGDFVLMVDQVVGKIRETLRKQGISDNTILVFTADNACSPAAGIPELQAQGHFPNYIFRGMKADLFEGGHRVPTVLEWPRVVTKGIVNQTVCLTDFYATFAEIAGYEMKDNEGEDSYSLLPLLKEPQKKDIIREAIVHHSIRGEFAIRKGDWKLLFSPSSGGWSYPRPGKDDDVIAGLPSVQLYNLKEDIGETKNVYEQHPKVVEELTSLMKKYITEGRSTLGKRQQNDQTETWTQAGMILSR